MTYGLNLWEENGQKTSSAVLFRIDSFSSMFSRKSDRSDCYSLLFTYYIIKRIYVPLANGF